MLTGKRRSKVKLIGAFIIIAGALVVVAAGVTLGMVSSELKAEHITVTGVAPEGLARPAAKPDADVFDSYAPAGLSQASSATVMPLPLFFIAAVALGVAAPVMGVGVMFAVVGIGPLKGSRKPKPRTRLQASDLS
jgi:drug/metabolite transporter (DMT)-like permease